jgi:hypothetical protein
VPLSTMTLGHAGRSSWCAPLWQQGHCNLRDLNRGPDFWCWRQSGRSLEHPETSAFATEGRAQTESTPLTLS